MIVKLFEMYRPDRSWVFKRDIIKKISYNEYTDILTRGTSKDFRPNYLYKFISNLNISDMSIQRSDDSIIRIEFTTDSEDLSWGGINPPILYSVAYNIVLII